MCALYREITVTCIAVFCYVLFFVVLIQFQYDANSILIESVYAL